MWGKGHPRRLLSQNLGGQGRGEGPGEGPGWGTAWASLPPTSAADTPDPDRGLDSLLTLSAAWLTAQHGSRWLADGAA